MMTSRLANLVVLFCVFLASAMTLRAQDKIESPAQHSAGDKAEPSPQDEAVLPQPTSAYRKSSAPIWKLLSDPAIRADIEMSEEQYDEFMTVVAEKDQTIVAAYQAATNLPLWTPDEVRLKALAEFNNHSHEAQSAYKEKSIRVLSEAQFRRLQQIRARRNYERDRQSDFSGVLSDDMIQFLDIGKDQAQRIRVKSQRVQADLNKMIKKLTREAHDRVLNEELTPEQLKKLSLAIGEPVGG